MWYAWLLSLLAVSFLVAVVVCWVTNVAGLPGNWLVFGLTALYAFGVRDDYVMDVGWPLLFVLLVLAVLGELVELVAGAFGVKRMGGSRRGAALALVGSLLGGVAGLFLGLPIPIPLVGSLVGGVLLASVGALVGATLGEQWKGRDFGSSIRIGEAAFWGRLLGTLGKTLIGAVMVALIAVSLLTKLL